MSRLAKIDTSIDINYLRNGETNRIFVHIKIYAHGENFVLHFIAKIHYEFYHVW